MKKISLELQPCCWDRSGIGTYTYEITKRIHNDNEFEFYGNVFNFKGRKDNSEALADIDIPICVNQSFPYSIYRRIWNYMPLTYNDMFPEKVDMNIFFNFIVPPRVNGCVMTAIHDLTYIRYPQTMKKSNLIRLKNGISYSVKRSDKILTVSNFSKLEIQKYLDVPEDKIAIVYNAPSLSKRTEDFSKVSAKYGILGKFILFVSTIEPRKNICRLLQAFDLIKAKYKIPHQLVLAGGKGWEDKEIYCTANRLKYSDSVIFTGYVSAEEKNSLYQNADIFVFPSMYEGFGIPPLEAMSWGCPVVCSNAASIPEIVGEAGLLVNPFSVEEIADGMWQLLEDDKLRESLIQKGYQQAKKFSWDASAEQLVSICRDTLK